MASNGNIIGWSHVVTGLVMTELAATSVLSPAPMTSQEAAATCPIIQDLVLEWLKVTVVPLGVFLVGSCIWDCFKRKSVAWKRFINRTKILSDTSGRDEVRPERLSISGGADGSDHPEKGIATSNRRTSIDDMAAISKLAKTVDTTQHAALQSPNGE